MKRSTMIEMMVLLLVISLGFSGCIGHQSFPLAARSGDTISLALGAGPRHETVPGSQITLDDLDIYIQQDKNQNGEIEVGEFFLVKKRYLFRIYPDPTSYVANYTSNYSTNLVAEWSVVVDLVDPDTGEALPLSENQQAEIVVSTSKLNDVTLWQPYDGSLSSIPVYILPGTGQSNNFNNNSFGNMTMLQPLPQLAISFSGSGNVASAAIDIDYDETVIKNYPFNIRIKQDIFSPNVMLNQRVYDDNGNRKIRILLMTNSLTVLPSQLKCFIVWNKALVASGKTVTDSTFNVTSAKFYNESGAEVTGINVVKTLLYQ